MAGSRQDMERCTVSVAGVDLGVFDSFAGGENDSDTTIWRRGGMGGPESLGGITTRGDFTVARNYRLERDHPLVKFLDAQAGIGEVVAVRTMLDGDKNPVGDPITFTGTLKTFTHPDHDSNASDAKVVSLVVTADGPIS